MNKFIKVVAVIYMVLLGLLAFIVPIGAITLLAKICGCCLTWVGACIPFFIALGLSPFIIISKMFIDLTKEGK